MRIFTHTTGRTGTMWLAELFRLNTDWECHHERLAPTDYGIATPDIREMRCFNHYGKEAVEHFWRNKIMMMPGDYVETAHMLSKAGLHEFRELLGEHRIIHLHRPIGEVVRSMLRRGDYVSHGNHWLWYLDPDYPNNKVSSEPFKQYGPTGLCAWYYREMEARRPPDAITVSVKELNDPAKARDFLSLCGVEKNEPIIPQRANASHGELDPQLQNLIEEVSHIGH